jgi:hypothetical protein
LDKLHCQTKRTFLSMKAPAVFFLIAAQAQGFTSPAYAHRTLTATTELNGLRSFIKRKLSRSKVRETDEGIVDLDLLVETEAFECVSADQGILEVASSHEDHTLLVSNAYKSHAELHMATETLNVETMEESSSKMHSVSLMTVESESINGSKISLQQKYEEEEDLDTPYTLDPVEEGKKLTELEQEFRDMLIDFSQFTNRDIRAVRNPRLRALFEGVAASYTLPEVYRAFEVLFKDYAPLRIAGRLIYGKLKQVMLEAQEERWTEVEHVSATTGMSKEDVEASRVAFLKLVVHEDDKATDMTIQQLVECGLAETVVEVLGYETFEDFLKTIDAKSSDKVGFADLMIRLQNCSLNNRQPECNPALVLQEVAKRLDSNGNVLSAKESADQKTRKHIKRYNGMVEKFIEWKEFVPSGDGRRLDILRGCFVGAESKEIVDALRIVYIDYSALRMSGDLIFRIMSALVGARQRRA